jgi:hypothetical protein
MTNHMIRNFLSKHFLKDNEISNLTKIPRVGGRVVPCGANGETDGETRGILLAACHNFATAPKLFKIRQFILQILCFLIYVTDVIRFTGYGVMVCLGKRDGKVSHSTKEGNLLTWWVNNGFYHTSEFVFLARASCFADLRFNLWGNSFACVEYYSPPYFLFFFSTNTNVRSTTIFVHF